MSQEPGPGPAQERALGPAQEPGPERALEPARGLVLVLVLVLVLEQVTAMATSPASRFRIALRSTPTQS